MEEYQVTRFVLALKGFQFISGCISLLSMVYTFWGCTYAATVLPTGHSFSHLCLMGRSRRRSAAIGMTHVHVHVRLVAPFVLLPEGSRRPWLLAGF